MVAAVVLMLRKRASLATGEAIAPQASSLTAHTTRLRMGKAMNPARSPRAPIASPEASHSRPPRSPAGFLPRPRPFTKGFLPGRRLEVPLLQDLLPLAARHEVDPLLREGRFLRVLERGYGIGRDDVEVGRDRDDFHLVPYIRRVVTRIAEGGIGIPYHDPVYRCPHVRLPGDHIGEDIILEVGSILLVRLAQDLHGVVGCWHVLRSEHELYVRLGHVLEAVYVGRVVFGDHDDLAVFDEHLTVTTDESVDVTDVYIVIFCGGEQVGATTLMNLDQK